MIDVIAYRWADYDTPLWANPNRSVGRWHRLGAKPTQYWALHPLGPWAEYIRSSGIVGHEDLTGIASRTWAGVFIFDAAQVARITFDNAPDWSISADDLVGDDVARCQDLAEHIRTVFMAMIVPSAALPGTENLVVFGPRAITPYELSPPDPDQDVPAAATADHGGPPESLLDLVRHRGTPHAGLLAWQAGAP